MSKGSTFQRIQHISLGFIIEQEVGLLRLWPPTLGFGIHLTGLHVESLIARRLIELPTVNDVSDEEDSKIHQVKREADKLRQQNIELKRALRLSEMKRKVIFPGYSDALPSWMLMCSSAARAQRLLSPMTRIRTSKLSPVHHRGRRSLSTLPQIRRDARYGHRSFRHLDTPEPSSPYNLYAYRSNLVEMLPSE